MYSEPDTCELYHVLHDHKHTNDRDHLLPILLLSSVSWPIPVITLCCLPLISYRETKGEALPTTAHLNLTTLEQACMVYHQRHWPGCRFLTSASSLPHLPEDRKLLHTVVATWLANSTVYEPVLAPPPIVTPLLLSSKTRDWCGGRSQKKVSQAGSVRNSTTGPAVKVHTNTLYSTNTFMHITYHQ